jgi:hypothetical protein
MIPLRPDGSQHDEVALHNRVIGGERPALKTHALALA